jgi:hypothetical protein
MSVNTTDWLTLVFNKITKAVDIKIVASEPGSMLPRKIIFAGGFTMS